MRRFAMDADVSCRVLYTLPAEASLYKWYQAVMGTTQTARGERIRIARQQTAGTLPSVTRHQRAGIRCTSGAAAAGANLRRAVSSAAGFSSRSVRHVRRRFGCTSGCGCAVVERDGDTLIIKELLGADTASAAQALLAAFDTQAAQVCLQRQDGAQPMAAYRPFFRDTADIFWGLYLD